MFSLAILLLSKTLSKNTEIENNFSKSTNWSEHAHFDFNQIFQIYFDIFNSNYYQFIAFLEI